MPAERLEGHAAPRVGRCRSAVEPDGPLKGRQGLAGASHAGHDPPAGGVGHGGFGIQQDRPFACCQRILEAPCARKRKGMPRVDIPAVGRQPNRLLVRRHGVLVAAEARHHEGVVRVRGRAFWIACDCIAERIERLAGPAQAGQRPGAPRMRRRVPWARPHRCAACL